MQFFVILLILFSVLISMAPFAHPGTVKTIEQPAAAEASNASSGTLQEIVHGSVSAVIEEAQISNPLTTVKETAEQAAKSLGRNLGQYIRGKYQQYKNDELLNRFNATLQQSLVGLPLSAAEKQKITRKIEEDYIRDAEKERPELDQQNFSDLGNVIKKEYSEILLGRTIAGTVDTYDLKGRLKTRWQKENGQPEGSVITYYPDQEIKYIDIYRSGKKVSRKKYDQEGKLEFEQHYEYEAKPEIASDEKSGENSSPDPVVSETSIKTPEAPAQSSFFAKETQLSAIEEMPPQASIELHSQASVAAQKPPQHLPAQDNRPV